MVGKTREEGDIDYESSIQLAKVHKHVILILAFEPFGNFVKY